MIDDSETRQEASVQTPELKAKVLIVDDDERNAYAAVHALESLGHELVVARSGEEALRRVLSDDFAVILLDLHMPGMDGYETAALIRSRKRSRSTPIVFVTAVFRDEPHLFQAYASGAVDVVFKPADPFILRAKVQVLVDLHLKTVEIQREAERRQQLLEENARVTREKLWAERALRATQARQESILRSLPVVFHARSAEAPYPALFVSDSIEGLTGFKPSAFTSDPEFGLARVHPDDRDRVAQVLKAASHSGVYSAEFRWRCADGTYRSLLDQGVLAPADEEGPRQIFGTMIDVTERRSLEQQLAQAQKMEAVGQLTGGVAHDFNNLLTVVLGNLDLLDRKPEEDPRRHRQLMAMRHAAERGRSLTRQLLAFSRRQHLSPVTVDVNALIGTFSLLMQQAVGDGVTIRTKLDEQRMCAHVDPAQLETALLNLAVNARDAMPEGGELLISTRKVDGGALARKHPEAAGGEWLMIEVRDNGTGIPPEVLQRVFEPFFTTKEVGKGSGLGLSQVYGFVRQTGGYINVESELGVGASFQLYLAPTDATADERADAATPLEIEHGNERVLAVEDDPAVLSLTVDLLSGLGYQVSTAADAREAMAVLKGDQPFDLLFTDVMMPGGVGGVQLARAARELRPDLKVLLTSGYVGEGSALEGGEFPLLPKPYERTALAAKVRDTLGPPATVH